MSQLRLWLRRSGNGRSRLLTVVLESGWRGARQVLVNHCQNRLAPENDVRGIFALIEAAVIMHAQGANDRAEPLGEFVPTCGESASPASRPPSVALVANHRSRQKHCPAIHSDVGFPQLHRQPVMSVEVVL